MRLLIRISLLFLLAGLHASCRPALPSVGRGAATSESPQEPWDLSSAPSVEGATSRGSEVVPTFSPKQSAPGGKLTVGMAVDLAMRNDPRTQATWFRARAAAARLGTSEAGYYPRLDVGATGSYNHQTLQGGRMSLTQGTIGPYAKLSWLLLDFGARSANEQAELAAVIAANGAHGAALQDQVLFVVDAYYRCVSAEALVEAAKADEKTATSSLEAATALHGSGKAALGDVLQSRTSLSRARMAVSTAQGQARVMRSALAVQLGMTPDVQFELEPLADDVHAQDVTEGAEQLLGKALRSRPDLVAIKAAAAASWQRAESVKHRGMPTLSLDANASRGYYLPQTYGTHGDNWGVSLTFNIPIFAGFSDSYEQQRAQWEAMAAEADARALERRIALDVWTAWLRLHTAAEQVDEASALLKISMEWEQLARGRYEAGVGTILDLMAAQSSLASARSQHVKARAEWILARVQLAHDAGELGRRTLTDVQQSVLEGGSVPSTPTAAPRGSSLAPPISR